MRIETQLALVALARWYNKGPNRAWRRDSRAGSRSAQPRQQQSQQKPRASSLKVVLRVEFVQNLCRHPKFWNQVSFFYAFLALLVDIIIFYLRRSKLWHQMIFSVRFCYCPFALRAWFVLVRVCLFCVACRCIRLILVGSSSPACWWVLFPAWSGPLPRHVGGSSSPPVRVLFPGALV